jgi:hypothetical protein
MGKQDGGLFRLKVQVYGRIYVAKSECCAQWEMAMIGGTKCIYPYSLTSWYATNVML